MLRVLRGAGGHAGSRQGETPRRAHSAAQLGGGLRDVQPSEGFRGVARVVPGSVLLGSAPGRRDLRMDGGCEDRTRLRPIMSRLLSPDS